MRQPWLIPLLIGAGVVGTAVYVGAAWQQKERLNLGVAAGGQYPYLSYAAGIAEEGFTHHVGDRNRMPLIPFGLALLVDDDWTVFHERACLFAIACSLVAIAITAVASWVTLPIFSTLFMILWFAVCVCLPKASFVQPELLYYALQLCAWLTLCRILRRPTPGYALAAGLLLALSYLTKASAAPTIFAYLATAGIQALSLALRDRRKAKSSNLGKNAPTPARVLGAAALVATVFLVTAGPYLWTNQTRFGRLFYNVNSTFYMWCDSWTQAKGFGEAYGVSDGFPMASSDEIPSLSNYWRSHTASEILARFRYGLGTLVSLAVQSTYAKYTLFIAACTLGLVFLRPRRARAVARKHAFPLLFSVFLFGGYTLGYAWYALIAYGDRFVLSIFAPLTLGLLWLAAELSRTLRLPSIAGHRFRAMEGLAFGAAAMVAVEGAVLVSGPLYEPTSAFVQFFYNESRELEMAGREDLAIAGYRGVIQLDPSFAAAHHSLGMTALMAGQSQESIASLASAVHFAPDAADMRNSLGSALLQGGHAERAIEQFQQAIALDPRMDVARYNLGGAYVRAGQVDQARRVVVQLRELNPMLARQLEQFIGG